MVAVNKKVISLLLASLFVLTIFVGHVSTAGDGGQQMPSHSTSLAEGSGLGRASDGSVLFSEFGQNSSYKSIGIAANDPQAGGSGIQAPRGSKSQYDLISCQMPVAFWSPYQTKSRTYCK